MIAMRSMMAVVMAVMVPLWCCCAIQQAQAAEAGQQAPAGSTCCGREGEEKPSKPPEQDHDTCECSQDKAPPPPALKVEVKPAADLLQSLSALLPVVFSVQTTDSQSPTAATRDMPPPPCQASLFSQHCLLLN